MREQSEGGNAGMPTRRGIISRRAFLESSGMLAGAALALGAGGIALSGCTTNGATSSETAQDDDLSYAVYDTDLLVIGTGSAGIFAAFQGYGEGARVMCVDKGPFRAGGATGMNWDQCTYWYDGEVENDEEYQWTWFNAFGFSLMNKDISQKLLEFHGTAHDTWDMFLLYARLGGTTFRRNEDGTLWNSWGPLIGCGDGLFPRHNHDAMYAEGLAIVDETMVTNMIVSDGICTGAVGYHIPTGEYRIFRAKAVIDASGPCTQDFGWLATSAITLNSMDATGDMKAAALRRGMTIQNADMSSYDLISFVPNSLGASFGAGFGADSVNMANVCDADGNYFLADWEVDGYVSIVKPVIDRVLEGKGGEHNGVFMDVSHPGAAKLSKPCYMRNAPLWKEQFGIDVLAEGNKVAIGVEQFENGAAPVIDASMMSEIPGYFSTRGTGEEGNGLFDQIMFGGYAAHCAVEYIGDEAPEINWEDVKAEIKRLEELRTREVKDGMRPHEVRHKIQDAVYGGLGLGCSKATLEEAISKIEDIKANDIGRMYVENKTMCFNTDWKKAIENYNLLALAEAKLRSSLVREESRNMFYRIDFPEQDDANWLKHVQVKMIEGAMEVSAEDVRTA